MRCMARRPEFLRPRLGPGTEVVAGDVLDSASLATALAGVDTAFYLVHSMESTGSFAEADRDRRAQLRPRRPGPPASGASSTSAAWAGTDELSSHLDSRQEVGRILRESGVPTIELRASIIIGSGSAVVRDDPRAGGDACRS